MDTIQTILLVVILLLTILLLVLGIQVFFILRDARQTVRKANKVLDDTGLITESVSGPVANLSTIISGVKMGATVAKILQGSEKKEKHHD